MGQPGRPSKLTPELQDEICGYIANGLTARDACLIVGIGETTFYRWKAEGEEQEEGKYRDFREACARADAEFKKARIRSIKSAGDEGDWKASAWLMERRFPSEFGRRTKLEHAGEIKGGAPRKVEVTLHRPPERDEEGGG